MSPFPEKPLETLGITPRRFWTLLKFLAAGGPAVLLAVPVNYLLVDKLHFQKALAYLAVLVVQVNINFFMCQMFVFRGEGRFSLRRYGHFMGGIMGFRFLDWCLYVLLVSGVGLHYLLVQLLNLAVFALAKFLFAESLFAPGASAHK